MVYNEARPVQIAVVLVIAVVRIAVGSHHMITFRTASQNLRTLKVRCVSVDGRFLPNLLMSCSNKYELKLIF